MMGLALTVCKHVTKGVMNSQNGILKCDMIYMQPPTHICQQTYNFCLTLHGMLPKFTTMAPGMTYFSLWVGLGEILPILQVENWRCQD